MLEEHLTLARAHDGETWSDAGAWSEELADSYLALGRVDDAVATIANATRWGYAEGAEMLYELADRLRVPALARQHRRLAWRGVLPFLVGLRPGTQPGGGHGLTMAERQEFRPAGLRAAATRISHGLSE